jgi:hypothetical protein
LPFTRTRDIWYGDERRIDAEEMDRLRQSAENAEFAQAVAGIEVLRNRMLESNLPLLVRFSRPSAPTTASDRVSGSVIERNQERSVSN